MTDRRTASTITDTELDALYDQLAALRQVARGYCPACGRGDAAPHVEDWEQQKRRADRADEAARLALEQRQRTAAERHTWQERGDRAEAALTRARDACDQLRRAPAVLPSAVVSADRATLRAAVVEVLRPHASLGGTPPRYEVPLLDGANPRLPRISGWKALDDVADAVLAVLPDQAEWDALCREAGRLRRASAEMAERAERIEADVQQARADRATLRDRISDTVMPFLLNFSDEESARINATEVADALLAVLPAPAPLCICGHSKQQHFEDACITEITGCNCGDYLEPQDAAEVIDRWRQAALQARATDRATLTDSDRQFLTFALDLAFDRMVSDDGFTAEDEAALEKLRRLSDGPSRVAAEAAVTPPPALTEAGRLRAQVEVLQQDAERDQGLAKVGARCMRDGHQGLIEGGRMVLEGWRFALSTALDLGTVAPWEAIHERAKELRRVAAEEQPTETQCGATVGRLATVLREVLATFAPMRDAHEGPVAYYDGSADIEPEQFARWAAALDGVGPCACIHPADEHSVYGCADDCGCTWMPKRPAVVEQPDTQTREAQRCPAKHGALGRICKLPLGHTGMHTGSGPNGGAVWDGDAP